MVERFPPKQVYQAIFCVITGKLCLTRDPVFSKQPPSPETKHTQTTYRVITGKRMLDP